MREEEIYKAPHEKKEDLASREELETDKKRINQLKEGVARGLYSEEIQDDGSVVIKDKKTGRVLL